MDNPLIRLRGRGTEGNATARFEKDKLEIDVSEYGFIDPDEAPRLKTEFFNDATRSILTENNSPDIPFRFSLNPYRGCEHGCVYCYARPTHEYLGLSAGLDFESKIFVKKAAPELLRQKLLSPRWIPQSVSMSGVTDCYQPAERQFQLTRQCLEVFADLRNPVSLITKNQLILRDLDILKSLAAWQGTLVFITMTTLDADLARVLEPRTSSPQARLKTIGDLAKAGIPVGVNVAPVIPGLTDHELPSILKEASQAGARFAGYVPLRLPHSLKELFEQWLATHYPERQTKVLNAVRSLRGGELNDARFNSRMQGTGAKAAHLNQLFDLFYRKYKFEHCPPLSTDHFRAPKTQLELF